MLYPGIIWSHHVYDINNLYHDSNTVALFIYLYVQLEGENYVFPVIIIIYIFATYYFTLLTLIQIIM